MSKLVATVATSVPRGHRTTFNLYLPIRTNPGRRIPTHSSPPHLPIPCRCRSRAHCLSVSFPLLSPRSSPIPGSARPRRRRVVSIQLRWEEPGRARHGAAPKPGRAATPFEVGPRSELITSIISARSRPQVTSSAERPESIRRGRQTASAAGRKLQSLSPRWLMGRQIRVVTPHPVQDRRHCWILAQRPTGALC